MAKQRTQRVVFAGVKSEEVVIVTYEVPQGNVLGPSDLIPSLYK